METKFSHRDILRRNTPTPVLDAFPDAIFVPFLSDCRLERHKNYFKALTLRTEVIFLASDSISASGMPTELANSEVIVVRDIEPKHLFSATETRRHPRAIQFLASWDLDIKRNVAIFVAKQRGYKRIILHDSDVTIPEHAIHEIIGALDFVALAGPAIEEFPDTSVLGHLQRLNGDPEESFVTGAALGIHIPRAPIFFPCIYNEDWFAVYENALASELGLVGAAKQDEYSPLETGRAKREEFGDFIAEALFQARLPIGHADLNKESFWTNAKGVRLAELERLHQSLPFHIAREVLREMSATLISIDAHECVDFMRRWRLDKQAFANALELI